jgi:hypothetical protein
LFGLRSFVRRFVRRLVRGFADCSRDSRFAAAGPFRPITTATATPAPATAAFAALFVRRRGAWRRFGQHAGGLAECLGVWPRLLLRARLTLGLLTRAALLFAP